MTVFVLETYAHGDCICTMLFTTRQAAESQRDYEMSQSPVSGCTYDIFETVVHNKPLQQYHWGKSERA